MGDGEAITIQPQADGSISPIELETGRRHDLVLSAQATLVRLNGTAFAVDKCFLLPAATEGIRALRTIFGEEPDVEVLVVGHTDESGSDSYNDALSLARAEAMVAFLKDDVAHWEQYFQSGAPAGDPWGSVEVQAMLSVLPDGQQPYFSEGVAAKESIRAFQRDAGLDDDGIAGPITRNALIGAYMQLDGTSLPAETRAIAHGCGESRPRGGPSEEDRRVEVFFFRGGVTPEAPAATSDASAGEYPAWIASAKTVHDIALGFDGSSHLEIRLHDEARSPMPDAPYRVTIGNQAPIEGNADGDGFVFVRLPPICPERVHVEWGEDPVDAFAFSLDIFPQCSQGNPEDLAPLWLQNLGYTPDIDLDAAVAQFQRDYAVDSDPQPTGLEEGALPAATLQRLESIFTDPLSDASSGAAG